MIRPYSVTRADTPAVADYLRVSVESTDEEGNPRLLAHEGGPALDRLGPGRAANALRARADAWAMDPRCIACGKLVPTVERAGLVETPEGARVDCGGSCHITALRRYVLTPLIPAATRAGAR